MSTVVDIHPDSGKSLGTSVSLVWGRGAESNSHQYELRVKSQQDSWITVHLGALGAPNELDSDRKLTQEEESCVGLILAILEQVRKRPSAYGLALRDLRGCATAQDVEKIVMALPVGRRVSVRKLIIESAAQRRTAALVLSRWRLGQSVVTALCRSSNGGTVIAFRVSETQRQLMEKIALLEGHESLGELAKAITLSKCNYANR
jgi:hypothetical protein